MTAGERAAEAARIGLELDEVVAAFADRFAPDGAFAAVYARYSTDFQHSIVDQIRACLEDAVRLGFRVRRADVHFDISVSGKKSRRAGLDALKHALPKKAFAALLIMTTNRLIRKMYRRRPTRPACGASRLLWSG